MTEGISSDGRRARHKEAVQVAMAAKRRFLMNVAAATVAVVALVVCAAPAGADAQDQQFFRALDGLGFVVTNPELVISQGHMICNEGLLHGVSWGEMHSQLLQWGYTHNSASILAIAAINTYCPQYSAVSARISQNLSN